MAFTYFYRDKYILELMQMHVIPELKKRPFIHIWDAGCATGQEPYTLAMVFRENMGEFLFRNLKIYATDIDASNRFGEIIRQSIYAKEQLTNVPREAYRKYFSRHSKPNHSVVHPQIRDAVIYQKHDLLTLQPIRTKLDMIVCKNVLLHFQEEERVHVLKMFHTALRDDGFLITEQTQKMPETLKHWYEPIVPNGQLFKKILRTICNAEKGGP